MLVVFDETSQEFVSSENNMVVYRSILIIMIMIMMMMIIIIIIIIIIPWQPCQIYCTALTICIVKHARKRK